MAFMSNKQLHKKWRKSFNEECLKRDNYKCVVCNEKSNVDVHHIIDRHEMPNGGYVMENGITLCAVHHLQAELYHQSSGTKGHTGMYPDDLYSMIDSFYGLAVKKSSELKS